MNAGEFANLQCIVPVGDLPLKISWTYPGDKIGGSSGILVKKVADRVSMLMITAITARHAGDYVCTAENEAGSSSFSTTLTVNGSKKKNKHTKACLTLVSYSQSPPLTSLSR